MEESFAASTALPLTVPTFSQSAARLSSSILFSYATDVSVPPYIDKPFSDHSSVALNRITAITPEHRMAPNPFRQAELRENFASLISAPCLSYSDLFANVSNFITKQFQNAVPSHSFSVKYLIRFPITANPSCDIIQHRSSGLNLW
jgi:hypothetical protein